MNGLLSVKEQKLYRGNLQVFNKALLNSLDIMKNILLDFNENKTLDYKHYLLNILAKYRFNIEAAIILIPTYKKDYRLKFPMNLILRSIASDVLTSFYLLSFYSNGKATKALENELKILSAEYLNFLIEIRKIEKKENEELFDEFIKEIGQSLLKSDGKIKSKKEIRESSEDVYKDLLKDNKGKFLTENQKYKMIKKIKPKDFSIDELFVAYKYFSQFQHFNLMSKRLIENKPDIDIYNMGLVLDYMVRSTILILQLFNISKDKYIDELLKIKNEFKYNDFE